MRVFVRYHEIALKGRNRPFFVSKLVSNLRRATSDLGRLHIQSYAGRVSIEGPDDVPWPVLEERLNRTFGIANFSRVREAPRDIESLEAAVVEAVRGRTLGAFRVEARRSDKQYPLRSADLNRRLGAAIAAATGAPVRLTSPDTTVHVEVLHRHVLYSFERLPGPGGMPVGTAGRVMALVSGGIDSPVAAWRMMKRGCSVQLVNFHAFPLQDRTMIDKVRELATRLTRWQGRTRLLLVPFAPVQQQIVAACPAPLRVVLYRRFMLRIAEALARRRHAKALVTGESLGQVASQTLDNLQTIGAVATLPVLRPLIGMDKDEITVEARRIDTFEVSTLPDQDCCQLYVPRSPAVAARLDEAEAAERELDVAGLVRAAVTAAEEERLAFPAL